MKRSSARSARPTGSTADTIAAARSPSGCWGGLAVVVAGAFFTDALRAFHFALEPLVFLIGALAATVGLYLLLNSLFRHRPNTTIIFPLLEGGEIIASYPDWDNPRADELTRHFARAKRSLSR